jgi:Tfp pilus assembly pilus retraction ATPase PilT
MELAGVLREAMSLGASDIHLKARQYPVLRVRGHLMRLRTGRSWTARISSRWRAP